LTVDDASPGSAAPRAGEKSIVIQSASLMENSSVVIDGGDDEGALAPISTSSTREPELADPPLGDPRAEQPTLADDYIAMATDGSGLEPPMPGSDDSPAADDVCVDEPLDAEYALAQPAQQSQPTIASLQASTFHGVTPGVSKRSDVLRDWGQPAAHAGSGKAIVYRLEQFPSITVSFQDDVVESLVVELAEPADATTLIEKLGLADLRPAVETDDFGAPCATLFPERGVTLGHRPTAEAAVATDVLDKTTAECVYEIVLRPIEAYPFQLRAETSPPRAYASRLADLETALRLDPKNAHVRWLLSLTRLATGAAVAAESLAHEAVELDPASADYRLHWARCLRYLARYDQAVEQTRLVLETTTDDPLVRAAALEQMGRLAALGSVEVQKRSPPLLNKAIELADPLAGSDDRAVAAAATQLLIGAHLAVAEQIAAGQWQEKDKFIGQWLSRASGLAEQMIADGSADVSLRLQVAVSALAAGSRLSPAIDPKLWVTEAEQAAAALEPELGDALARAEVNWYLGLAYSYAVEISHRRSETAAAIRYGELAEKALVPAAAVRQELPDTSFALGRLYFQIGAVYAVHKGDHQTACQWYDRAIEPLSKSVPVTTLARPGLHGDALVSMAVSYWETGDRQRAFELTQAGLELMEQGVAEGLLTADSLEVARGNLEAMGRALGKIDAGTPAGSGRNAAAQLAEDDPRPAKPAMRSSSAGRSPMRTATRRNAASGDVRRR
jgi:tetratricopeptide (TPR) repeat protein